MSDRPLWRDVLVPTLLGAAIWGGLTAIGIWLWRALTAPP